MGKSKDPRYPEWKAQALAMREQGFSNIQIAKTPGCSTVTLWRVLFDKHRIRENTGVWPFTEIKNGEKPPIALLRQCVRYEPETGDVYGLVKMRRRLPGKIEQTLRGGYCYVNILNRRYRVHRLAFALENGVWPIEVDHINGDPTDNRFSNLRECLHKENLRNVKMNTRNLSGYKGVSRSPGISRFKAQITCDGVVTRIGVFPSPLEAARAYDEAALRIHGEFARINNV